LARTIIKNERSGFSKRIGLFVSLYLGQPAVTTIIMPSPWHKMTARTPIVRTSVQQQQRDYDVGHINTSPQRLSKKQLSLSANRESLVDLLKEQVEQKDPCPTAAPVRHQLLLHKMQKMTIKSSPSTATMMTAFSSSPSLANKPQQPHGQLLPNEQRNTSAISSRRTLQESASDLSSNNDTAESSVEVEHVLFQEAATAPAAVTQKKQKMRQSYFRKSLRHLVVSKMVPSSVGSTTSNSILKKRNKDDREQQMRLPDPGIFSNNHILVNRERVVRGLSKLHRCRLLDEMAQQHAARLARDEVLVHSVAELSDLQRLLGSQEVGENVQRGPNIRQMHESAMNRGSTSRGNILRPAYVEFGMATALGPQDGKLYMVQLFRGRPKDQASVEQQQ
jgi:uncharacterized protein YkwD